MHPSPRVSEGSEWHSSRQAVLDPVHVSQLHGMKAVVIQFQHARCISSFILTTSAICEFMLWLNLLMISGRDARHRGSRPRSLSNSGQGVCEQHDRAFSRSGALACISAILGLY